MFVVSTTTLAALVGFSGSLGDVIATKRADHFLGVLGAAICVAALALIVDGVLAGVQRLLTPRGLRLAQRTLSERPAQLGVAVVEGAARAPAGRRAGARTPPV